MTRFTDGDNVVEISMCIWDGHQYGYDWEDDFYDVGNLDYDERFDAYIVEDVEYLVEQAKDWQDGIGDFIDDLEGEVGHNPDDRYVYVDGVRA